jgi:hypothetical protein
MRVHPFYTVVRYPNLNPNLNLTGVRIEVMQ